ncbi:MAG: ABC transporter permease subunit [Armatimonadota bacterium]|nr:ABC transporter permease subunit [Armatimonadota bacterium]
MGCLAVAYLSIIETLRRKEFYVVLVLIISLAVWLHLIDISESSTGRFAKDIVMQVVWLASFALAVPLAARQIPQDVESKTVYVILARPIPRWQYVLGRVIGASGASCLCLIGLFLVLVVMLFSKGDAALADAMLWQALVLQLAALFMVCSLAVFQLRLVPLRFRLWLCSSCGTAQNR